MDEGGSRIRDFLKRVALPFGRGGENVTPEDIMSMVNEGHEQGVLEASEAEMITNIFGFEEKQAGDIMTHRKNVVALDERTTLRDASDFIIKEATNSRIPVYEKNIDHIIGILHLRDVLRYAEKTELMGTPIGEIGGLLREPYLAPETKSIGSLFKEMQSQKIHLAVIVDEYGQTAGIVTMEDILEEIVGNIMDEYDKDEEPEIIEHENHTYELDGLTLLEDAEAALGTEFDAEDKADFATLNGLLVSKLGRFPEPGERPEVTAAGYRFTVTEVDDRGIQTVLAVRD